MNIRIICVGKIKEKYLVQGIDEYMKRLSRYAKVEFAEVEDERAPETLSPAEELMVKEKEAARISKSIRRGSFVIALAIEGQSFSSEAFARRLDALALTGQSQVDFIIGGSLGLDASILRQADLLLSFSSFTFPHQLMRLILVEQIYRAFKILKGETYHK